MAAGGALVIRVFIADDHPVVRHGLRRMVEEQPEMSVVGEASNGHQVLSADNKHSWDVLVLDLSLPKMNGLEVLSRLRELAPRVRVLVLSALPAVTYAAQALRQGAAGFLSKDNPPSEIVAAIRSVARGNSVVPTAALAALRAPEEQPPHARLSTREYQVFVLIAQGRAVIDVAAELNVAQSTVSNHVARIKEKLGASTLGDIVNYAHDAGLVGRALEPPE